MKYRKFAIVMMAFLLSFVLVFSASAASVTFASGDGTATSSTGNVYAINPHPVWDTIPGASWVSAYQGTGYGQGVFLPNSSGLGNPTMVFTQVFNLPYMFNTGTVRVGADDTMAVWLNGHLLKQANLVLDNACASGPVACQPGEFMDVVLNQYLVKGTNTLQLDVYQLGGDVSGAIWKGSVTSTPEPATYAMLGAGFVFLGLLARRRKT